MGEDARRPLFESYTDEEIEYLDGALEAFARRTKRASYMTAKIYQDEGGRWHFFIKDEYGNPIAKSITEYGYLNSKQAEVILNRLAMVRFIAEYEEYRENPIKKMEREINERERENDS